MNATKIAEWLALVCYVFMKDDRGVSGKNESSSVLMYGRLMSLASSSLAKVLLYCLHQSSNCIFPF